ncbi:MAG: AraC family transcriptional regulator [Pseudomonadota bacterium]
MLPASLALLFTGGTLSLLMALAIAITAEPALRRQLAGQLAIGFLLTFGAYLMATSPLLRQTDAAWHLPLRLFDSPNLALLWLFLLTIYKDHFVPDKRYWLVAGAYMLLMVLERLIEAGLIGTALLPAPVFLIASLGLITHLVAVIMRGHENDLVETRRRSRRVVIVVIIAAALLSVVSTNHQQGPWSEALSLIASAGLLVSVLFVFRYWTTIQTSRFLFDRETHEARAHRPLTERQQHQLDALERLMIEAEAFKVPDLSIKRVARELGIGEHLLRPLINSHLGHRNFPAFLNHYRVSFATERLQDATQRDLQIARIATDAGFHSLSAFNRAFKQATGKTPTAFRRDALSD